MQLGGLRERCKLPQRVRAEPGRQTTFGAYLVVFWSENTLSVKILNAARVSGERCQLPQRVPAEPGRQTTFGAYFV